MNTDRKPIHANDVDYESEVYKTSHASKLNK